MDARTMTHAAHAQAKTAISRAALEADWQRRDAEVMKVLRLKHPDLARKADAHAVEMHAQLIWELARAHAEVTRAEAIMKGAACDANPLVRERAGAALNDALAARNLLYRQVEQSHADLPAEAKQ